ncbi:DUF6538 domain-containing protein [Burkholderia sp. BCC1640]|uniref:DUF6538 domain-containing protein n=1 Tax=Burkholderia sp. BCC1640 TaxID=2676294 RepID=UPI00158BF592|nr:DUF6538 domain-containing protein [Burkholderia sp. BCC1640]
MPSQHCLTTRRQSAVPQFRRAIPADLQQLFGRLELGGSLHTREKAEAKRRRNALVAATDSLFDDARMLRVTGSANRDALLHEFTRQRELICAGRAVRYSASPEPATEPCDVPTEDSPPCWPAVYDEVFSSDERPAIKAHFCLKPSMIPRLIARRRAVMLQGDDVLRSTDSREDVRAMREGLAELEQDITDDIARDDTSAIREEALTLLAYEGILSLIRPVVGTAIDEEITSLAQNPFAAVTVHVSEKDIRSYQPFSAGQLQRFFDGPVHHHGERPGKGGRDAAFWLPLLALFAGVRLEEAGTLSTASVFQRAGSYWVKIGESKSANSSLREVPVHRVLEEKGFIEFVERQRRQRGGNATLFPNLRPKTIDGKKTRMYSTWVNEYIDAHVIDDAQYTFHVDVRTELTH